MTFDLKEYQRRALARLGEFLRLARTHNCAFAYKEVAMREDENGNPENPYANRGDYHQTIAGLDNCPHVCLRIPTGGGKTYLAARSVEYADRFMETEKRPTVLWLAPSDAIRAQTAEVLKDRNHPCRIALEEYFGFDIIVRDIGDFDATRPQDFDSTPCIIVSTAQMFRIRTTAKKGDDGMTKATRRIYASHELLQPHFERFLPTAPPDGLERDAKGNVKHSFVNLLHLRRPLVISDEAHNFLSDLSHEVMRRINPRCILEWTATPREKPGGNPLHNVLVSVSAEELHAEEMLKLPVRLTEHKGWEQAVNGAVMQRKQLAKAAKESGDAVRPIVLYQAQSNTGKDAITPAKLREHLIAAEGIDDSAIAIATGEVKDLRDIDLFAPGCPIEHIITVQALREGWDCSYAYILCSVANMQSDTAVEQLMGRVMRMPEAKRRKHKELNLAYAHLPSDIATDAVELMRDKMANVLGFEEKETRDYLQPALAEEYEGGGFWEEENRTFQLAEKPAFDNLPADAKQSADEGVEVKPDPKTGGYKAIVKKPLMAEVQKAIVAAMPEESQKQQGRRLEAVIRNMPRPQSPSSRGVQFAALPQLFFYSPVDEATVPADGDFLHTAADWNAIGDDCLISGFAINETANTFEITIGGGRVVFSKQGSFDLPPADDAGGEGRLVGWLERQIRHTDGRYNPETLQHLVNANINALIARGYRMPQLVRAKYQLAEALKQWLTAHEEKVGQQTAKKYLLGNDEVECRFSFAFPAKGYDPARAYTGNYQFRRHYYDAIGHFDSDAEYKCAKVLDANDDVRHWVRNVAKTDHSYRIPLAPDSNFYPDFVAELTSGEVLVVEYKGGHIADKDKHKKEAGELLERKAKGKCFFVVITEGAGKPQAEAQIKNKIRQIREGGKS